MRSERSIDFDGLTIAYDDRVLEPRPWTTVHSAWAAELAADLPAGPILELCCGAGHIGLAAARRSGRALVQVDVNPAAVELARRNAAANGLAERCTVVHADLTEWRPGAAGLDAVPLVVADPPYVPSGDVARFPDDPTVAIDGGADGLDLLSPLARIGEAALRPGGSMLVQLASPEQADVAAGSVGTLVEVDRRTHARGVVVRYCLPPT
jgi:methylase of polypeptide subunit release factors